MVNEGDPGRRNAVIRLTKSPRDTWAISKSARNLGQNRSLHTRPRLPFKARRQGPRIRLYMHETGTDLERVAK